MEPVSPTRTEMITRRAQIRLAEQGAELLRGKREALVREFLTELRRYSEARGQLARALAAAGQSLIRALAVDGPEMLASVALASRRGVEVDLSERNIWGTRIVEVKTGWHPDAAAAHRPTAIGATVRTEDATERYEAVLERIIAVAPLDRKMHRLAEEIRKTTRRVNAVEQRLLPELREQVRYIRGVLDQREREDIFRLKRLKRKR
jgi:V/A-type H+-transporting ATPase subunit D